MSKALIGTLGALYDDVHVGLRFGIVHMVYIQLHHTGERHYIGSDTVQVALSL